MPPYTWKLNTQAEPKKLSWSLFSFLFFFYIFLPSVFKKKTNQCTWTNTHQEALPLSILKYFKIEYLNVDYSERFMVHFVHFSLA